MSLINNKYNRRFILSKDQSPLGFCKYKLVQLRQK